MRVIKTFLILALIFPPGPAAEGARAFVKNESGT